MPNVVFAIEVDDSGAVTGIKSVQQSFENLGKTAVTQSEEATSAFDRLEKIMGKMQSAVIGFIGAFVFREIISGLTDMINLGIDFEAQFARVKMTVEGTNGALMELHDLILDMSRTLPITAMDLAKIAESAGQVGVEIGDMKEFATTIAEIATTTHISGDEAAVQFKRLAQNLGEPISRVKELASTIVDLDAKNAASAPEILAFASNIASAGNRVHMTSAEVIALATELASTGVKAEKGGSAISKVMQDMSVAVSMNTDKLKLFAKVAGFDVPDAFAKAFKKDAADAILKFEKGLFDLSKVQDVIPIMEQLGLKNLRVADTVGRVAVSTDNFKQALKDANAEINNAGASLDQKMNTALGTTASQLQEAKNRINLVFIALSNDLQPSLIRGANALADLAEGFHNNATYIKLAAEVLVGFAAGIAAAKIGAYVLEMEALTKTVGDLVAIFRAGPPAIALFTQQLMSMSLGVGLLLGSYIGLLIAAKAWYDEQNNTISAEEALKLAQDAHRQAQDKAIESLRRHGIEVMNYIHGTEDMDTVIARATEALVKQNQEEAKAAAIKERERQAIEILSKAQQEHAKKVQEGVDDMMQIDEKTKIWIDTLYKAMASGVSMDAILEKNKGKIVEYIQQWERLGKTQPLEPVIKLLGEYMERLTDTEDKMKATETTADEYYKKVNAIGTAARTAAGNLSDMSDAMAQMLLNRSKLTTQSLGNLGLINPDTGYYGIAGGTNAPDDNQMITTQKMDEKYKQWKEFNKKIADDMAKKLDTTIDHVLNTLLKGGKGTFKALVDFFQTVMDPIFDALMAPFKKKLMDVLTGPFQQIADGIASHLKKFTDGLGNTVAGVFGGVKGGALAGMVSGVASAGIGAAVSMGIQVIGSLFKKSGSEVNNNLVQKIQNPFTEAVGNLMHSFEQLGATGKLTLSDAVNARTQLTAMWNQFKTDSAAYAALGSKNALAVQGAFNTISQNWGPDLEKLFHEIDGTIESLGGTAGMTSDDLDKLNASIQAIDDFKKEVDGLVSSITEAADAAPALTAALTQAEAAGIPADMIIAQFKDRIIASVEQLRALGREIPAELQKFYDLTKAEDAAGNSASDLATQLSDAQTKFKSLQEELATVTQQLSDALVNKLDYLQGQLSASTQKLADYNSQLVQLNQDMDDTVKTLNDASYWQKRYDDIISEAQNAYEAAVEKRKNLEQQISDLQKQIEEDKLQQIIKTSKNATIIKLAQQQLDRLNQKSDADRIQQLKELQAQLVLAQQAEATALQTYKDRTTLAQETVVAEQIAMRQHLIAQQQERDSIYASIDAELQHRNELIADIVATETTMDSLGISRQSEIDKINNTIIALKARKTALEAESTAINKVITSINALITATGGTPVPVPPDGTTPTTPPADSGGTTGGTGGDGGGAIIDPTAPGAPFGGIVLQPTPYAMGSMYIQRNQLALLHKGERVLTANENRGYRKASNFSLSLGNVQIVTSGSGEAAGVEAAQAFVRMLETNGDLRRRMEKAIKGTR